MRRKSFTLRERTELIPIELVAALKPLAAILPCLFILGGLSGVDSFWANAWNHGLFAVLAILIALMMGAVVNPLLLPYIPGRAFALKGFVLGILGTFILLRVAGDFGFGGIRWEEKISLALMLSSLSSFLAMNFTGASTYTSLSGVKKEMRWAVPLEIAGGGAGIILWLTSMFIFGA
jgi:acetyl-CoA decarbonylase/synthase complex subunit gamma